MCVISAFYKKFVVHRYDPDGVIKYFTYEDFPGLTAEPISFATPQGVELKGNIYAYPDADADSLVVFAHGIGGGHRSYLREIELLCNEGYRVVGFDNAGCFASGGKNIRGLTESVNDLNACLNYLRSQPRFAETRVSLVGHSWGGYAVGNVLNLRDDIHAAVVISGFVSTPEFVRLFLKGKHGLVRRGICRFERRANPDIYPLCSADALEKTSAKALVIHSRDDAMVPIACGLDFVRDRVKNPNVRYLELEGKYHNPNYSDDAVRYMRECFGAYEAQLREKRLKTDDEKRAFTAGWDYLRMTAQDEGVWKEIFDTIK
ncbi:MAG: alpha/beta fold hydrolase [Clostridia bacterium]|nr:alpha/beta fold hydrolase [Clostridia bacterium]